MNKQTETNRQTNRQVNNSYNCHLNVLCFTRSYISNSIFDHIYVGICQLKKNVFCFNWCCPFLVLCYGFLHCNTRTQRMLTELYPTSNFHCLSLYGTIIQCQIKLVLHVSAKYLLFLRPDTVLSFHYIGVFMHTPHANTLRLMCMDSNTSIRYYMSLLSN